MTALIFDWAQICSHNPTITISTPPPPLCQPMHVFASFNLLLLLIVGLLNLTVAWPPTCCYVVEVRTRSCSFGCKSGDVGMVALSRPKSCQCHACAISSNVYTASVWWYRIIRSLLEVNSVSQQPSIDILLRKRIPVNGDLSRFHICETNIWRCPARNWKEIAMVKDERKAVRATKWMY